MKITKKKVVISLLLVLGLLSVVAAATYYYFSKYYNSSVLSDDFKTIVADGVEDSHKNRINVLVLGMEHTRTDMIMVASFDPVAKTLNMISIPRDTFVERDYPNYYPYNTYKKINAIYELPTEDVNRLANKVSEILGVPIHEYAMVNYDVVAQITDAVGGVDVDIPFDMDYDDPWSDPPLHVHFKKGPASLTGQNAIEYLRWRHNNDGSYGNEGDVGRVKRQQNFMGKVLEKALNPTTLPLTIDAGFKNVKTSLSLNEVMGLVKDAVNIPKENIHFYQEVGEASYFYDLWYFLPDVEKTQALMKKILNNEVVTEADTQTTEEFKAYAEKGLGPAEDNSYQDNSSYRRNNNYNNDTTSTRRKHSHPIETTTHGEDSSSAILDNTPPKEVKKEDINNSVNNESNQKNKETNNNSNDTTSTDTNNKQNNTTVTPDVPPSTEQTTPSTPVTPNPEPTPAEQPTTPIETTPAKDSEQGDTTTPIF